MVAAAVILPEKHGLRGLNDSKMLEVEERERLEPRIRERAVAVSVAEASVDEIERLNILQASRLAMKRAVETLIPQPDYLLVDAVKVDLELEQKPLIKGDARCQSIAAASIVAKVYRDRLMAEMDSQFPGYGIARHKGYATPEHREALERLGPTAAHRKTFLPVAQLSLLFA